MGSKLKKFGGVCAITGALLMGKGAYDAVKFINEMDEGIKNHRVVWGVPNGCKTEPRVPCYINGRVYTPEQIDIMYTDFEKANIDFAKKLFTCVGGMGLLLVGGGMASSRKEQTKEIGK